MNAKASEPPMSQRVSRRESSKIGASLVFSGSNPDIDLARDLALALIVARVVAARILLALAPDHVHDVVKV